MMRTKSGLLFLVIAGLIGPARGQRVPTIDELIGLETIRSVRIAPSGEWIAYTTSVADFDGDSFVSRIRLVDVGSGRSLALTRGPGSAFDPKWSPDGARLAFVSNREGEGSQLYTISPRGGAAVRLTESETGVSSYEWSPDGTSIAFIARDGEPDARAARTASVGDFTVVRREYRRNHLWLVDVPEAPPGPLAARRLTAGDGFHVRSFAWSPDGSRIAFSAAVSPDVVDRHTSDVYVLELRRGAARKIVEAPGPDDSPHWSPDGASIVYVSHFGRERYFGHNSDFALVPSTGGEPVRLTESFDEIPIFVTWNEDGIYFLARQRTASHLFRLDPTTRSVQRVSQPDELMARWFTLTADGRTVAFCAASPSSLMEVHIADIDTFGARRLTDLTRQTAAMTVGTRELISWRSRDGMEIEGILIKPADFDPDRAYPLLCVLHSGPTGIDRPILLEEYTFYYPVDIWVARGAIVLAVNYRGSTGYGESFRLSNVRNLGLGASSDVLAGVDHLIARGWIDTDRMGCMGWSHGGYLSAFLTVTTDRFVAASVGAGITDWRVYYYGSDLTPLTLNYLAADPEGDPEIYAATSPMNHVGSAGTPTLIQHGEHDRRVPIWHARALRQALADRGVPVEMIVYNGFGHGILRPRAQRAVMWHNLVWFNHHVFGDPLPDLSHPEIAGAEQGDR